MTKVSVLVPVYNVENYLRECLDSIIDQTIDDYEIICINDGSTDSSLDILKEYAEKYSYLKIINKQNSGYGSSLNIGLNFAQGEYISIIESDDFVMPDMLESLYELATNNNCDIVKSDWFNYWTKDDLAVKNGKIPKGIANKIITASDFPEILVLQPSIWSAIYKKDFLLNNDIHFLETPGASYQDTSFSFKAFCLAEKILLTEKSYLYYRQDNAFSSINSTDKAFSICNEYEEINKFLNNNKKIKNQFNTQRLISQYKAYIWTLKRIAQEFRLEFTKMFSRSFCLYYADNEISEDFIKKVKRKNIDLLICNPEAFLKQFEIKLKLEKFSEFRRNLISVKINTSRISIKLLGKQIVSIG